MQTILAKIRRDTDFSLFLRHSAVLYVGGLISIALTFAQQLTTANLLGVEAYGRLAIVLSLGMLFAVLLDLRTNELGTKLLAKPLEDHNHREIVRLLTWFNIIEIVSGLAGSLLLIVFAEPAARYLLNDQHMTSFIRIYALSVPFRLVASGIVGVLPRFYDRFDWLAIKSIANAGLRLLYMTGAAWLGLGIQGVIIGALLSEITSTMLLYFFALLIHKRERSGYPFIDLVKPEHLAEIRGSIGKYWLNSLLIGLHYYLFIPFAALLTSPLQIGLLRTGMDIGELIEKAVQPLQIVFSPKIIMLYAQGKLTEFRRFVRQSALILNGITLTLALSIMLASPLILPLLYPADEFQGLVSVVILLVVGYTVFMGQYWTRPALVTANLLGSQNILLMGLLIASAIQMIVLISQYGAIGAALAKTSFLLGYAIISFVLVQVRTRVFSRA